jgi:hypothetical protein
MVRLAFLVSGNDSYAVSYNFCIDHLIALRSSGDPAEGEPSINRGLATDDELLVPDENGWVARSEKAKIQGNWFVAHDDGGSFATFQPTLDLGMCTSAMVAKDVGPPGAIWGALIGLSLNATDPPEVKNDSYDAERYGVTGFAFDIDSEPAPGAELQVEVSTLKTLGKAAYWGGSDFEGRSPVHAGHNEFRWNDVGGPWWVPDPPMFEWRDLMTLTFLVPSNRNHPVSYRFCIKNLTALRH